MAGVHEEDRLREWLEAERRLEREPRARQQTLDVIVARVLEELRRSVGRPFQLRELVAHYDGGTAWAVDLATRTAPGEPWAWAPNLAIDAAYGRYARFARDVGGGRVLGSKRGSERWQDVV